MDILAEIQNRGPCMTSRCAGMTYP